MEMMLLSDLKTFLIETKYYFRKNGPSRTPVSHVFDLKFFPSFYDNHKEPEINCVL